jgi:hypothetical protein
MTKLEAPPVKLGLTSALTTFFVVVVTLLVLLPPAASADLLIGSSGSGAGQYREPGALAVDQSNGNVYLADQGNYRVDVFDSAGNFLRAFGWGVADGTSAEPQTCTTTCFPGLPGRGAGQFSDINQFGAGLGPAGGIAVDNDPASPSYRDVYVFDGARVQKFTPGGAFIAVFGGGVVTSGAKGTGTLLAGSATVSNVTTTERAFIAGQTITGPGIPANTKIVGFGTDVLVLSKPATASGTGVTLSVAAGPGHKPINQIDRLTIDNAGPSGQFSLNFSAPAPAEPINQGAIPRTSFLPSEGTPASTVQQALENLPNLDPGDISVTGPNGGPYTIEFKGTRYTDTRVSGLERGFGSGKGDVKLIVLQNGASVAETCTAAIVAACTRGVPGNGEGQFSPAAELGPTADINSAPVAVAPGGVLHVKDFGRLQKWDAAGSYAGQIPLPSAASGMAVDSAGNLYLAASGVGVQKFDPAGNLLSTFGPTDNLGAIAIDSAGNIFIRHLQEIIEFDSSGTQVRAFFGAGGRNVRSLAAFHTATGEIFAVEESGQMVQIPFPPPGPVVFRPKGASFGKATEATAVGNSKATLKVSINPEGKASTYHFQYVDQAHFEAGGFANPAAKTTPDGSLPANFAMHLVSEQLTGLAPETTYHFRVIASNPDGTDTGPEETFTTLAPFEINSTWASEVGTDSAAIHAEINPLGLPTTAHFQFVVDATYQATGFAEATEVPDVSGGQPPLNLGSGEAPKRVEAALTGLTPNTVYHYRILAQDSFVSEAGPERTFITFSPVGEPRFDCPNQAFRGGGSARLPACRAYEMVSPPDKNGGDVAAGSIARRMGTFAQSAADGSRATFSSLRSFADPAAAPLVNQYLATRTAEGWSTASISLPRLSSARAAGISTVGRYQAFTEDLCGGWVYQDSNFPLVPGAPDGYPNLYRRQNCLAEPAYELLTPVVPPGFEPESELEAYVATAQGFSADLSHTVFRVTAAMTKDACVSITAGQLYENVEGGELRLVSALPNGKASCASNSVGVFGNDNPLGFTKSSLRHAVSRDGSRVYWTKVEGTGFGQTTGLYVRINATAPQSKVAAGKCTEAAKACTLAISETPSVAYWDADPSGDTALYTVGSLGAGAELFEYDLETRASHSIAKGVEGVVGASEGLFRIYFISNKALSGEQANGEGAKAQAGKPNLYLDEGGALTYVGTLASPEGKDASARGIPSPGAMPPVRRTSRISPDGLHLAFASAAPLTGYDNADVASGVPAGEIYLYDAVPGAAGELRCVSCNPSRGRPSAKVRLSEGGGFSTPFYEAAELPGWNEVLRPSNLLSDDGTRLLFESFDPLVLGDTNGKTDVYEWQRASSSEECAQAGAGLFAPAADGCLSLISSGHSPEDSELIDASRDGSDVFFTTGSSLVGGDTDLVDLYDARTGGGFAEPTVTAACEGEACQGPISPPNDPTPASSTFEGAGNVRDTKPRCPTDKAQRKGRCKTGKHKKHSSKKRANKERRAGR